MRYVMAYQDDISFEDAPSYIRMTYQDDISFEDIACHDISFEDAPSYISSEDMPFVSRYVIRFKICHCISVRVMAWCICGWGDDICDDTSVGSYGICNDISVGSYGITVHVMICITHDISFLICISAMEIFFTIFSSFSLVAFFTIFSSFSLVVFCNFWISHMGFLKLKNFFCIFSRFSL